MNIVSARGLSPVVRTCSYAEAVAFVVVSGCAPRPTSDVTVVRTVSEPPELVSQSSPVYPEIARKQGIEGDVLIEMVVDTAGRVHTARVLYGPVVFHDAARAAALSSVFAPARDNGRPIPYRVIQRFHFQFEPTGDRPAALPLWEASVGPAIANPDVLRSAGGRLPPNSYGDVLVEVVVEATGAVDRTALLMGSLSAYEAVREVLERLRFTPARLEDAPRRVSLVALVSLRRSGVEFDVRNGSGPLYDYWKVDMKPVFVGRESFVYQLNIERETPSGEVSVGIIVDTTGAVEVAWVLKGPAALREPALDIARGFRCIPAQHDGRAVRVWLAWRINFAGGQPFRSSPG